MLLTLTLAASFLQPSSLEPRLSSPLPVSRQDPGEYHLVRKGWLLAMGLAGDHLCIVDLDQQHNRESMMLIDRNGKLIRKLPRLSGDLVGGSNGLIYASDDGRVTVMDQKGKVVRRIGSYGKRIDQFGMEIDEEGDKWFGPQYIAVGAKGDVYGYDDTSQTIKHFSAKGKFIASIGHDVLKEYLGAGNLALDLSGDIYVSAMKRDGSVANVLCLSPSGKLLRTYGTNGKGVGKFSSFKVWDGNYFGPGELAVGPDGTLYAQDSSTNEIQVFDHSGKPLQTIPRHEQEYMICKLAVDKDGTLFIGGSDGVFTYRIQR